MVGGLLRIFFWGVREWYKFDKCLYFWEKRFVVLGSLIFWMGGVVEGYYEVFVMGIISRFSILDIGEFVWSSGNIKIGLSFLWNRGEWGFDINNVFKKGLEIKGYCKNLLGFFVWKDRYGR